MSLNSVPEDMTKNALLVLAACGATVLNIFLNGALVVILPTIGKDLNMSEHELQWPLNVYALSYGCLLLLCGRLADITGSKCMFLLGTAWFALWSIATALAPNSASLIIFVALIGVGAAANTPTAVGIFSSHFEPGEMRNHAITALGAGQGLGYVVGLILGGSLSQTTFGWRVIFYIQGALAAFFVILGILFVPSDRTERRYGKGVDWIGASLSTIGVGLFCFILIQSTSLPQGWKTPWVAPLFVISLFILVGFVLWEGYRERKDKSVIMPLSIWMEPGTKLQPMIGLVFLAWASFNSLSYFLTLYLQQINMLDQVSTAIRLIPVALSGLVVNVITGSLLGYISGRMLLSVGLLGSVAAPIIFALIDLNASYWTTTFLVAVLVSFAEVAYTVGNLQVTVVFDEDSQALAGGIFNVATRLGTSFGLSLTTSISTAISRAYHEKHPEYDEQSPEVLMPGFRAGGWTCFVLALGGFIIALVGMRGVGVIGDKNGRGVIRLEEEFEEADAP
ncbi:efflux protein [Moniliophthora roreri MCA 2997]|uniref:Efflux protein n=2 Tax=Moniliophthora roreri TaxID=221103 RepID=V2YEV3_MONRO|nr:efflux protein [Moniliophthora roreri MCA 2997]